MQNRPQTEHEIEKARLLRENELWLADWNSRAILSLDELEREGHAVAPLESDAGSDERRRAA